MPYAVVVEKTVPISRQRFFAELMDFGGVAKLSPEAGRRGRVRRRRARRGPHRPHQGAAGPVIERLDVAYDERLFAYSIINETALPLERYIAVVELADAPGGGCHVRWGSNWIAKGSSRRRRPDDADAALHDA